MTEKKFAFLALLFILALGAFLRFHLLAEFPLGLFPDEAMNGNNARQAISTGSFKIFYPENNGREGLYINLQALPIWLWGNEPWALRLVSVLFGTLTIIGTYLLTKELLSKSNFTGYRSSPLIAILASFFLATSYWHLNFSRIGFRAITVPLLATFALYFLLKGLRRGKTLDLVFAGVFTGAGFYSYIAFRFMPFVLTVPIIWYLWKWLKRDSNTRINSNDSNTNSDGYSNNSRGIRILESPSCTPCAVLLFIFITFVVALPIGYYFLQNPEDFFGRTGQVSVFTTEGPLWEFVKSNALTLGMLFFRGDCNWRHNFACQPQLHPLVATFFLIGFILMVHKLFRRPVKQNLPSLTLLAWFLLMMFPATLTREGLPHALRSIGMIPPVMILAGYGAWWSLQKVLGFLEKRRPDTGDPARERRLRIECTTLFTLVLFLIPLSTYHTYFIRWAQHPKVYEAFMTDVLHIGKFLKELPPDTKKYVVTEVPLPHLLEVGTPAQTVMFLTDTFLEEERIKKNLEYVAREDIHKITLPRNQKVVMALFNGENTELIRLLKQRFPELHEKAPQDFVILRNY